jgi:Ca2+/Na+ antiporter
MSRFPDVEGWILVVIAAGAGLLAAWVADSRLLSENMVKATVYTMLAFACLVMALRPAWRRLRLWVDLVVLLVLHIILVLPFVNLLDSHSIRLNWGLALPFVAAEFLLLLGLLWRRNVGGSSL